MLGVPMATKEPTGFGERLSTLRRAKALTEVDLSKAIASSFPRLSSGPPPFTSTPPRAARATPLSTALGVAIASAHGLAATSTAMAR